MWMQVAKDRQQLYRDLMKIDADVDTIFYELIAKQQQPAKHQFLKALRINAQIVNDQKGLLKDWQLHFHRLGTQTPQPQFDQDYQIRISNTKKCITEYI